MEGVISFLIALFGGIYYIVRYTIEKTDKEIAKREYNYRKIFRGVITAPISVSECGERLFSNIDTTIQTIDDEIRDDIEFIFGKEWRDIFKSFVAPAPLYMDIYMDGFDNILNIAFRVWLSKRGYVNSASSRCENINPYFGINGVPLNRRSEIAIKTCYVLEKNIQQQRPESIDNYTFFCHKVAGLDRVDWNFDYLGGEKRYLWKKENGSNLVTFDFGIPSDNEPHRFESYHIN